MFVWNVWVTYVKRKERSAPSRRLNFLSRLTTTDFVSRGNNDAKTPSSELVNSGQPDAAIGTGYEHSS